MEFKSALRDLHLLHDASFPYNLATNGVAENVIHRLNQSGLSPIWWAEAVRPFANYRNVTDLFNGESPYYRYRKVNYTGPLIPFGAAVRYLPNGPTSESQHTFA